MKKIAIIGAGIGGLTTAIAIRRFNPQISVEIYESGSVPNIAGAGLALAANAIIGFEKIGLKEKVLAVSNVLEKFAILDEKGKVITATDQLAINTKIGTVSNFSVHRAELHDVLLKELRDVPVHFGKKCSSFSQNSYGVRLEFSDGSRTEVDYTICADGIHSIFRKKLLPESDIRFSGYTCWRGVTDVVPEGFDSKTATETWSSAGRFGIVPLTGGRIYWFACINADSAHDPKFADFTKNDLAQHFKKFHAPVSFVIENTDAGQILHNDIIDFKPVSTFDFGRIVLTGDAAHATTPNMGQGACQAIEDAVTLGLLLKEFPDAEVAFQNFTSRRIKRTSWIVTRSFQIGKIAQMSNPLLGALRNTAFRMIPKSASQKQIEPILKVSF